MVLLLLSACNQVTIPDTEWCGDMGSQGAACFHTLSTATENIPEPQWDDVRFGMICTSGQDFADFKKIIEQLCSISNQCDYNTTQQINNFFNNVNSVVTKTTVVKQQLLQQKVQDQQKKLDEQKKIIDQQTDTIKKLKAIKQK